jgi:hypothetical protein
MKCITPSSKNRNYNFACYVVWVLSFVSVTEANGVRAFENQVLREILNRRGSVRRLEETAS